MQLFRNFDHCGQETTGGLESYHRVLKVYPCPSSPVLSRTASSIFARTCEKISQKYHPFLSCIVVDFCLLQEFFLNPSKHGLRARRVDWLLHILLGELAEHYMHKEFKEELKGWNTAAEAQIKASISASDNIDEGRIQLPVDIGEPAFVRSSDGEGRTYRVTAPGTAEAGCECVHFMRGNLCKHIIKVRHPSSSSAMPMHPVSL